MNERVKLDCERAMYVIREGYGYACLGYQVCAERVNRLKAELEELRILKLDLPQLHGSIEAYEQYEALTELASAHNRVTGYKFKCDLTPQLIGLEGRRVEVETFQGEVYRFIVRRSTGFIPIHIELKTSRSSGGCAAARAYKRVEAVRARS